MDDFILEKRIREALRKKAENIAEDGPEQAAVREKVRQRIREEQKMKFRAWKKTLAAAAVICIMGSITAMGLGKAESFVGHSNLKETVTEYEKAAELQSGYNGMVKSVKEFSNGYTFASAVPRYGEAQDKDGNTVEQNTAMVFTYRREGNQDIFLEGYYTEIPEETVPDRTMILDDGTEVRYSRMQNKFVPPDYVPTAEEEKLAEEGKLNLAYGSDEVEESVSSAVMWQENDILYSLFTFDGNLTAEEMFEMAEEVHGSR